MQQKLVVNGPSTPSQAAAKLQLDDIIFFNSYASILVMMRTINSCDMPAAAAASNRTETVGSKNWSLIWKQKSKKNYAKTQRDAM